MTRGIEAFISPRDEQGNPVFTSWARRNCGDNTSRSVAFEEERKPGFFMRLRSRLRLRPRESPVLPLSATVHGSSPSQRLRKGSRGMGNALKHGMPISPISPERTVDSTPMVSQHDDGPGPAATATAAAAALADRGGRKWNSAPAGVPAAPVAPMALERTASCPPPAAGNSSEESAAYLDRNTLREHELAVGRMPMTLHWFSVDDEGNWNLKPMSRRESASSSVVLP